MKGLNWTAVGAFAFMIAGCASSEPPASGPTPPTTEAAQVEVTNQNWSDVVVYAVRLNQPVRLGMVTSMSVERFKLPRSTASSGDHIRLMISPIGSSQRYTTEPIVIGPGKLIEFKFENHVEISSWSVR